MHFQLKFIILRSAIDQSLSIIIISTVLFLNPFVLHDFVGSRFPSLKDLSL